MTIELQIFQIQDYSKIIFIILEICMRKLSAKQKQYQLRRGLLRHRKQRTRFINKITIKQNKEIEISTSNYIILPKSLNFAQCCDETLLFFKKFRHIALVRKERVRLDFSQIKNISPAASIVLLAEIYRCWKFNDVKVMAVNSKDCKIASQLYQMGFYSLLEAPVPRLRKNKSARAKFTRYISFETATTNVGDLADKVRDAVFEQCPESFSEETKDKIYKGLLECMSNVSNHAYDEKFEKHIENAYNDRRWWLSGYVDKRKNEVMIQFFDQGAGISNTLPTKFTERVWNAFSFKKDSEIIELATKLGESATKEPHRGKGLPQIIDVIKETKNGSLRIMSEQGECKVQIDKNNEIHNELRDFNYSLGGTLIQWKVSDNE